MGYLLGSAHVEAFRAADLSAAESVALRFPLDVRDASLTTAATLRTAAMKIHTAKSTAVADPSAPMREARNALLDPMPMMTPADQDTAAPARIQMASAEDADTSAASVVNALAQAPSLRSPAAPKPAQNAAPASTSSTPAAKVAAAPPRRPAVERPGYVLNDSQIASIKERLHLTPDQEQMWPAVEAALRNIAYSHTQQARGRGVAVGATQTAAVDPEAVQGLKSAAVPLILSFNAEQKEEVRNLVHVMGLDQLASQF